MTMRQLPLDLQFLTAQGRDDFIIGDSNRLAAAMIDRWPGRPAAKTTLPRSGRNRPRRGI
jgi:chromosomal replication initiation ATPase DnaA